MSFQSKVTLLVDNALVVDAFLVTLQRHQNNADRPLRLLCQKDIGIIQDLDRAIARKYYAAKAGRDNVDYKQMRDKYLDACKDHQNWTVETRNLYGSILSLIQNWKNKGARDEESRKLLAQLHPGADLLLRYMMNIQLALPL